MRPSFLTTAGIAMLAYPLGAFAQQFEIGSYPFDAFNLTDACFKTLNTTVPECSFWLYDNLPSPKSKFDTVSNKWRLANICVPACRDTLVKFRTKALAACNTTKDSVAFLYGDVIFPPTYQVDLMTLAYDVFCYKDRDTGKLCDPLLTEWKTHRHFNKPTGCEDCVLGRRRQQLQAPIRYNAKDALDFAATTFACSATGYECVKPTQYATTWTTEVQMMSEGFDEPTPTP